MIRAGLFAPIELAATGRSVVAVPRFVAAFGLPVVPFFAGAVSKFPGSKDRRPTNS